MTSRNRGLVKVSRGVARVQEVPFPKLRGDYILVRTEAVALNPADWQDIDDIGADGSLVGIDFAGTVEAIGKDVQKNIKIGDRVAGLVHGS